MDAEAGTLERAGGAVHVGKRFEEIAARARALFAGRRVVNVNSTAAGGGVAELLQTLLAYARIAGVSIEQIVDDTLKLEKVK